MMEQILLDTDSGPSELAKVPFSCFIPAGVHESGLLGGRPQGVPNNLMMHIAIQQWGANTKKLGKPDQKFQQKLVPDGNFPHKDWDNKV